MPKDIEVSAGLVAVLPSGRAVTVGNHLTVDEARDLVILQRGIVPLRPMAQQGGRYEVALHEAMSPALLVAEMFSGAPPLIVNVQRATTLAEAWVVNPDAEVDIPIPIGGGRFVPRRLMALNWNGPFEAFMMWELEWMLGVEVVAHEAERGPRGLA
jgi:hypothetical protein